MVVYFFGGTCDLWARRAASDSRSFRVALLRAAPQASVLFTLRLLPASGGRAARVAALLGELADLLCKTPTKRSDSVRLVASPKAAARCAQSCC